MLRLRRTGEINGQHILKLFCSTPTTVHPATRCYRIFSCHLYQWPGAVSRWESPGLTRNVVDRVIEGAYEVVGVFDRIEEKRDAMQSLVLPPPARQALAQAARLTVMVTNISHVTTADILAADAGRIAVGPVECLSDHPGEYAERRDFRSQCKRKTYLPGHSQH